MIQTFRPTPRQRLAAASDLAQRIALAAAALAILAALASGFAEAVRVLTGA